MIYNSRLLVVCSDLSKRVAVMVADLEVRPIIGPQVPRLALQYGSVVVRILDDRSHCVLKSNHKAWNLLRFRWNGLSSSALCFK